MKSILISIKPKYVAKILNGEKKVEVRKENVGKAVQKLIDEQGFADIYVRCSMAKHIKDYLQIKNGKYVCDVPIDYESELNGKILFKFRCYKIDEWDMFQRDLGKKLYLACLSIFEFVEYSKGQFVYALKISNLVIFDKPKELSDFVKCDDKHIRIGNCFIGFGGIPRLTKAPESWCYVEGLK